MKLVKALGSTLLIPVLVSCGGQGPPQGSAFIPDVQITCSSSQVSDCAATALTVFVGLISSIAGDCDDFLAASPNSTQRRASFAASGTAVSTRNGIYLTAAISDWVGATGGAIDNLESGIYTVCAFADTNANDRVETGEPVGRGSLTVGSTGFVLSDWAPAFN